VVRPVYAALSQTLLVLAACSSNDRQSAPDASAPPVASCSAPERVPTFADLERGILLICRECHSASVTGDARHGAPEGLNFDTYEQFANAGETASYLVRYGIMPKPDAGKVPTEEQRQELYDWAACGKPR
jgi:uncharacterized membrane protein